MRRPALWPSYAPGHLPPALPSWPCSSCWRGSACAPHCVSRTKNGRDNATSEHADAWSVNAVQKNGGAPWAASVKHRCSYFANTLLISRHQTCCGTHHQSFKFCLAARQSLARGRLFVVGGPHCRQDIPLGHAGRDEGLGADIWRPGLAANVQQLLGRPDIPGALQANFPVSKQGRHKVLLKIVNDSVPETNIT